tara:strand:+ start:3183 stop:3452 length:270 start_codon:yes stop_codon:yes gene_type:complete
MEFQKYHTDTDGSWGIGAKHIDGKTPERDVIIKALNMKAHVIVKTSKSDGYWYIKGFNNKKSYDVIREHIENNERDGYRKKSNLLLIRY